MKVQRFTILVLLGIVFLAPVFGEEKVVSLPDAIGIKEIVSATVIHSPKGFSSQEDRVTSYVTNRETLDSFLKVLSDFPSKGGVHKQWPKDIAHWRIYIHGKDKKVVALNVYGYSLQSPIDATFSSSANDPKNTKLMKLLNAMLKTRKRANKPDAGDGK